MTKHILHTLLFVCIVSAHHVTAQQPAENDLGLNGLAVHAQLRNDVYMGAVYTEVGSSNAQMLLDSDQNKRMELRVLAKRWSARGFAEHWNQALLINNSEQDLAKFAREVRQFTSAIRGKLIPGDKITIDYSVKKHTRLSVDGVQLLSVSKEPLQFFQLLLRCWVGPRPPSTEFKNNILNLPTGESGAELLARYEALLPVSGRNKTIMAWREGNSRAAELAAIRNAAPAAKTEAPRAAPRAEQPKAATAPKQKAAQIKPKPESAPAKADRVAGITAALSAPQATAGTEAKPPAKPAENAAVAANVAGPDRGSKSAPVAASSVSKSEPAEQTILEQAAKAAAPTEPLDEKNGLLSLYKSNLLKRVYGFVIYPERAIDRNQEGTVVLQVTVNRRGKVLSIKNDEPSRYRLLNSAATRAIKKASPFPAAPRKLKGKKFDLEFPIVFRIPRS